MFPFVISLYAYLAVGWDLWEFEALNPFSAYTQEGLAWRLGLEWPAFFLSLLSLLIAGLGLWRWRRQMTPWPVLFFILLTPLAALWPSFRAAQPVTLGLGGFAYLVGNFLMLGSFAASRRWFGGDRLLSGGVLLVVLLLALFVIYPMVTILLTAFSGPAGYSLNQFLEKLRDYGLTGVVLWNSVRLALFVAVLSTGLAVLLALLEVRSRYDRWRWLWRSFSILPMITPPFVVGLSLIFLFGRAGLITNSLLGIETNLIIGFPGLALAQVFSFVPLSVMILTGALQGIDPSLEEASFTLGARHTRTFQRVTWKLLRPALANCFLLAMIESFADFANPIVIGGDYRVLPTEIYFAVIGKYDERLAAALSLLLLAVILFVFMFQHLWVGRRSYVTVGGKPQAREVIRLHPKMETALIGFGGLWSVGTLLLYLCFFLGAFVRLWGVDFTPSLEHFRAFLGDGLDSFVDSITLALLAAPLTALLGLWSAYITKRQQFLGRRVIEFVSLVNFAIPGTVVGLGYLLAFNDPPWSMTGTAFVLVFCFVFRNMAVGMRAGAASLAQVDRSLEESSMMLRGSLGVTLKRVLLPLLRGTVVTAVSFGFVRAITAISAIIFLVSAKWNLATKVILDRIEYGKMGVATAYCIVLVLLMGVTLVGNEWVIKKLTGRRMDLMGAKGV